MTLAYDIEMMQLPWTESPFFEQILARRGLSDDDAELARRFARDGYLILDVGFDDFDAVASRIVAEMAPLYPEKDRRVTDAWSSHPDVKRLALAPRILEVLRLLYGREPIPFQTLNFDLGTEQALHSDMIHFYSTPRRYMCGVWVALEDMDLDNGPLVYCPGSQKLPDYHASDIGLPPIVDAYPYYEQFIARLVEALGLEREYSIVKKGQALIWAANLLHGGSPIRDKSRTRHSQVTHYYFDDCTYYVPRLSQHPGRLRVREVVDLRTGEFQPNVFHGQVLDLDKLEWTWRYPRPLGKGFTGTYKQRPATAQPVAH